MLRVLLVQTQDQTAQFLARFFKERGDAIAIALDLGQAATYLTEFKPDLMVLDLHFHGDAWLPFLRLVRLDFPEIKILVTNRHPDLQREMRAREQGVKVFVRQPFTQYWLNKALKSLGISMVVPASQEAPTRPIHTAGARSSTPLRVVRIPVRVKITLPYVLISVFFALAAAYLISQVILQNAQDRFYNQLVESRVRASNWMVSEEGKLLEVLRLISSLEGLSAAVKQADSEALRSMVLPLIVSGR